MAQLPRPAADAVEERGAWADALDVSDSDLRHDTRPPLPLPLRPCTTSDTHSPCRRIPGPASSIQDAMRLRSPLSSAPAARADDKAADSDFLLAPWLRALRLLGEDHAWQRPGIGAIRGERALHRARLVVGMVILCTPNGLGGLLLNLKDPTGTIGASVHMKVLSDGNLGNGISVGSVIVLKQVAVFRQSRTVCYLNVTQENVVKVLHKDGGSPSKQVISSSNSESHLSAADCTGTRRFARLGDGHMESRAGTEPSEGTTSILSTMSCTNDSRIAKVLSDNSVAANAVHSNEIMLEEIDSSPPRKNVPSYNTSQQPQKIFNSMNPPNCQLKQGGSSLKYGRSTEAVSSPNNIMRRLLGGETMTSDGEWMLPASKKLKSDAVLSNDNGARTNSNIDILSMDTETEYGLENNMNIGLEDTTEEIHVEQTSIRKHDHRQKDFDAANTVTGQLTQENCSTSCPNATDIGGSLLSNPKKFVSVASVREWTDEQLSELFIDY